jgi:hypothetical protein
VVLEQDLHAGVESVVGAEAEVVGGAQPVVLARLAQVLAELVGPGADHAATERVGHVEVASEVLDLGLAVGVAELGEAAGVGADRDRAQAEVVEEAAVLAQPGTVGVGRQVARHAEDLEAAVAGTRRDAGGLGHG